MQIYEEKDVYYSATMILPYLKPEMKIQVEALLAKANAGEKTDNLLLETITSAGGFPRAWLRSALLGEIGEADERLLFGRVTLAGNPNSIPAGSIWICPNESCDFEWHVRRAGQPVPPCPNHKVTLIPKP